MHVPPKKQDFSSVATVFWRDVYGNGFTKIENDNEFNEGKEVKAHPKSIASKFPDEGTIDAIFLDLP